VEDVEDVWEIHSIEEALLIEDLVCFEDAVLIEGIEELLLVEEAVLAWKDFVVT